MDHDREFIGDLSEWGKTDNPEIYDLDQSSTNKNSLSSGISPREIQPAKREWNTEEAYRSLAFTSAAYGSLADNAFRGDLETRVTYQQLKALAGMAGKVQDVILHNKAIFERRIIESESTLQRTVLVSWKAIIHDRKNKKQLLQRAVNRLSRGLLTRSFFAWTDRLRDLDRQSVLIKKVSGIVLLLV